MLLPTFFTYLAAASALVVPRDPRPVFDGSCCFGLRERATGTTILQEISLGSLYVGGRSDNTVESWYCMNLKDGRHILRDPWNSACYLRPEKEFVCQDPTPSLDVWTLESSGASRLLANGGRTSWLACPSSGRGNQIWGTGSTKTGCKTVQLEAYGFLGKC
ncbi:hypothetical protein B0I35DRAFT_405377 [Stachybotrys elegans]|uniref:Ricin B lectin domain-containing protein n=1 Tax=Stachybotrys elegans TaxID=80388 RepID=A0A8K0T2W1_9HYPO|nr:hypothetical protein B0I35DRAFT_405377 [Stachybotrys elegans]